MKNFNKQLIVFLALICFVLFTQAVFASGAVGNLKNAAPTELSSRGNLIVVIAGWVQAILALTGVALILVLIYAGVMWGFMAQGEPAKVQKAKQMITNAIIGLVIVFGAYAIAYFVTNTASKAVVSGGTGSQSWSQVIEEDYSD